MNYYCSFFSQQLIAYLSLFIENLARSIRESIKMFFFCTDSKSSMAFSIILEALEIDSSIKPEDLISFTTEVTASSLYFLVN